MSSACISHWFFQDSPPIRLPPTASLRVDVDVQPKSQGNLAPTFNPPTPLYERKIVRHVWLKFSYSLYPHVVLHSLPSSSRQVWAGRTQYQCRETPLPTENGTWETYANDPRVCSTGSGGVFHCDTDVETKDQYPYCASPSDAPSGTSWENPQWGPGRRQEDNGGRAWDGDSGGGMGHVRALGNLEC